MRIIELSRKTGVSVRSLRYYEMKNLLFSKRLENGYRDYDEAAIERVKTIQLYLSLGLTTDDILQIIACPVSASNDRPLCTLAREVYQAKLEEVNKQLILLHNVQAKLQARISGFTEAGADEH